MHQQQEALARRAAGEALVDIARTAANELVIEGKATIRKRVVDVDEQYRVESPISQA